MKTIDKAKQLIDKMSGDTYQDSINNAIVAVDEIIEQWDYIDTYLGDGRGELNPNLKYWYEVKGEILLILNVKYNDTIYNQ